MKNFLYTFSIALLFSISMNAQVKEANTSLSGDEKIYNFTEVQVHPSFPGETMAFQKEIFSKINIGDNGAPSGTRAKVFVSFIVEKDGSLTDVVVRRDPGYGFGNEVAEAIIQIDKKWSPGIFENKPVRVKYTLPVSIQVP